MSLLPVLVVHVGMTDEPGFNCNNESAKAQRTSEKSREKGEKALPSNQGAVTAVVRQLCKATEKAPS